MLCTLIYISLLLAPLPAASAAELAGVTLHDTYMLADRPLVLNGAGVRSKLFIDVYVGALYLPRRGRALEQILAADGPKSMHMHVLYKEVSTAKIASGWDDGFRANLDTTGFAALQQRLQTFNALFPDLQRGDVVRMDYVPGQGTQLSINGRNLGRIDGEDFFSALLRVWIGEHPADADLKRGLLGQD